ncbi:helix-turn-helix transcriptional regulator [Enterobacteriaceae bacterium 89]|nr:helix-turn-helix transcriptional regulator [Enterobacteriaceae bacterium 89]
MILILTKDAYFLNALKHLLRRHDVIHITSANQLSETEHKGAWIIIDTLNNNIFHSELGYKIRFLSPKMVYVISPFMVKRCLGTIPTVFVDRNIGILHFVAVLQRRYILSRPDMLSLSHKQHQILTLVMQQNSGEQIAEKLGISLKTYYSHKYNIMLLLKLRKMSEVVRLNIAQYLV